MNDLWTLGWSMQAATKLIGEECSPATQPQQQQQQVAQVQQVTNGQSSEESVLVSALTTALQSTDKSKNQASKTFLKKLLNENDPGQEHSSGLAQPSPRVESRLTQLEQEVRRIRTDVSEMASMCGDVEWLKKNATETSHSLDKLVSLQTQNTQELGRLMATIKSAQSGTNGQHLLGAPTTPRCKIPFGTPTKPTPYGSPGSDGG